VSAGVRCQSPRMSLSLSPHPWLPPNATAQGGGSWRAGPSMRWSKEGDVTIRQ
jgi:hypothetical protein